MRGGCWLWPVALALTVTYVSGGQPEVPLLPPIISLDKLAHFLVFGLLATAILRNIPRRGNGFVAALLAAVATSIFGMIDEIYQNTTPGRQLDIWDWLADTMGAFTAALLYAGWPRYRRLLEYPLWSWKVNRSILPRTSHEGEL